MGVPSITIESVTLVQNYELANTCICFFNQKFWFISGLIRQNTNEDTNMTAETCKLTLEDLPDEIQLKIFQNLRLKDIIYCANVSKKLRRVCHDASLWQKVNLSEKVVPTEFLEQILSNGCQYLR